MKKKGEKTLVVLFCLSLIAGWWFMLPTPLFHMPYSTVVTDRKGQIIGSSVADDEQFRFPGTPFLSPKYIVSLITFEDKRFLSHRGVDFTALLRACRQNLTSGKIVSGGSTISMQVVRIARGNPPRT